MDRRIENCERELFYLECDCDNGNIDWDDYIERKKDIEDEISSIKKLGY